MDGDGRCYRHGFELAESTCRNCGLSFCSECLVYAFGAGKPPYCIACALAAAGVRSNAARNTTVSRREMKKLERDKKKADKHKKADKPKVEVAPMPVVEVKADEEENPFAWADDPDAGQRVPF
jgi:hypothetical protein